MPRKTATSELAPRDISTAGRGIAAGALIGA